MNEREFIKERLSVCENRGIQTEQKQRKLTKRIERLENCLMETKSHHLHDSMYKKAQAELENRKVKRFADELAKKTQLVVENPDEEKYEKERKGFIKKLKNL